MEANRNPSPSSANNLYLAPSIRLPHSYDNDMSSAAAAVQYYSSVPTFIPPTSFSDTGVPTFDPSNSPSPQPTLQDISSPPSSNHAHPTTPSPPPPPEPSNPYASDPWAPQLNQSIRVHAADTPPRSPNLQARKTPSRFAVPAPSSGAAGYNRYRATTEAPTGGPGTSPRPFEQDQYSQQSGAAPVPPSFSVTPQPPFPDPAAVPAKSGKKDPLTKSFSRLSFSLSGRSKSGKKNASPPSEEPQPPASGASPAPSVRQRSFQIPQTLEEWEAFNKAVLSRPPASHQRAPSAPQQQQQSQRPASTHLRPPSGTGMLPGPRLAASLAGSPLASPGASPRRGAVALPPPPIVLGEWERKRLAEAQGIPFPSAAAQQPAPPPPQQQHQHGESRPTTPGDSNNNNNSGPESKRSSLLFLKRNSSNNSPSGSTPNLVPKPSEPSPVPPMGEGLSSPKPVPLSLAVAPPASSTPEPEADAAPTGRQRTVSLPSSTADHPPLRPHLAPIQTDLSSPSLKWSRPKSWMGKMKPTTQQQQQQEGGEEYEPRVSIEKHVNPNSNGARMRARRRSSVDLDPAAAAVSAGEEADKRSLASEGGRMRNLLRKRRPSNASESGAEDDRASSAAATGTGFGLGRLRKMSSSQKLKQLVGGGGGGGMALPPGAAQPMLGKSNPQAQVLAVSPGAIQQPSPSNHAPAEEKPRSRRFSFGMKNASANVVVPGAPGQATASGAVFPSSSSSSTTPAADGESTEEKRRSRRFSFGLKNAPSPAAGPSDEDGDKRRPRRISFGMKNPFKKESSVSSSEPQSTAPVANPHALLPPGAARPGFPSRAGSQGTLDAIPTPLSASNPSPSPSLTPPGESTSSPPLGTSSSPLLLSRSANNSSQSLASKVMNPLLFKRKPAPSLGDDGSFVMVPTLNKGKGKTRIEISEAERERLERMTAPPVLPDSRPQTPSDNTVPVRYFGAGKRESFFADGDDINREEKIDEKNNRVSRFLSQYAANNELGLAIPSPSLKGVPLAPSSTIGGDSTNNSVSGHSDTTTRMRTPDRFEY
ncbi:hypothetical protein FRB90_005465 [Tulasnella sp. 427]|nr:hypothetical protein FRB90_005465 [Tulasnella sp. 427]